MGPAAPTALRFSLAALAGVLGCFALWIVAAESLRSPVGYFPKSAAEAQAYAEADDFAAASAAIGWPRGDLAAARAVSYYSLISRSASVGDEATASAAAGLAPYDPRPWLILAAQNADKSRSAQLLKMSYYTAPASAPLFPLRLQIASQQTEPDDELSMLLEFEIRNLIRQDAFRETLVETYRTTSGTGRSLLDRLMASIDPALLTGIKR